jgi:SAM-dependent methyltransferase
LKTNKVLKNIKNTLLFWGFDPRVLFYNLRGFPGYFKEYMQFKNISIGQTKIGLGKLYPALGDRYKPGGSLTDHYFYQDLIVAQRIHDNNPVKHIDVGSRIDGFVTHVASFREIEVFDIRPLTLDIPNVRFVQADFMNPIQDLKDYTDSISSLHALEHFGLGRYGDPLDPDGHLKGIESIAMVLKKNGKFYFSSPIGPLRVEFNAHRVFSISYLLGVFKEKFRIDRFSYIDDKKILHQEVDLNEENIRTNCGCKFGCGIFEMTRI